MKKENLIGWSLLLITTSFADGARWMHRCWVYSQGKEDMDNV
jgi:hypothetical protein